MKLLAIVAATAALAGAGGAYATSKFIVIFTGGGIKCVRSTVNGAPTVACLRLDGKGYSVGFNRREVVVARGNQPVFVRFMP